MRVRARGAERTVGRTQQIGSLSGALSKEMQNSVLVQNSLISKHQKMLEAAKQETAGKEQVGAHPQRMQRCACAAAGQRSMHTGGRIGGQAAAQSQSGPQAAAAHTPANNKRGKAACCIATPATPRPGLL